MYTQADIPQLIKDENIYWFEDPAHAWLCVPRELCEPFKSRISTCSYDAKLEGNVYLEEDCDATLFVEQYSDEVGEKDIAVVTNDTVNSVRNKVRRLPHWSLV